MAGLNLYGDAGLSAVTAAAPSGPSTITARAYGVDSGVGSGGGPRTAGLGSASVGAVCAALLLLLWHSLPR